MARTKKNISITLDPDVAAILDTDAKAIGLNRSAYISFLVSMTHLSSESNESFPQQVKDVFLGWVDAVKEQDVKQADLA